MQCTSKFACGEVMLRYISSVIIKIMMVLFVHTYVRTVIVVDVCTFFSQLSRMQTQKL